MNDKKQNEKQDIDEMYKDICEAIYHNSTIDLINGDFIGISTDGLTRELYDDGYRKQREGRWVRNEDHNAYESPYFCSECLADCSDIQGENYCYNCGAYMKGGE